MQRMGARSVALEGVWVKLKSSSLPHSVRGCLRLDRMRMNRAVGAYWNDMLRLKARHKIHGRLNKAKVAAYTIKWLLYYSPVVCVAEDEEVEKLSGEEQSLLLEANCLFAIQCLFYLADALDPTQFESKARFERVMRDLRYYLSTSGYQEKMASVLFDALIIASESAADEKEKDAQA